MSFTFNHSQEQSDLGPAIPGIWILGDITKSLTDQKATPDYDPGMIGHPVSWTRAIKYSQGKAGW